jgi:hypothetical protein
MSNLDDIVQRISELVAAITDLLALDAVDAIVEVASDLGATSLITGGLELLIGKPDGQGQYVGGLLRELLTGPFTKLEEAAAQLDALGGLLGMLQALVDGLGGFVLGSAVDLESYGLALPTPAIATGVRYASQATRVLDGLVIREMTLDQLRGEFQRLIDTLADKHRALLERAAAAEEEAA